MRQRSGTPLRSSAHQRELAAASRTHDSSFFADAATYSGARQGDDRDQAKQPRLLASAWNKIRTAISLQSFDPNERFPMVKPFDVLNSLICSRDDVAQSRDISKHTCRACRAAADYLRDAAGKRGANAYAEGCHIMSNRQSEPMLVFRISSGNVFYCSACDSPKARVGNSRLVIAGLPDLISAFKEHVARVHPKIKATTVPRDYFFSGESGKS